MILSYRECKALYKTDYEIRKRIREGFLKKVAHGIYSTAIYESDLNIICTKYPQAVFTLNSAFFYYDLTDTIPQHYHLITDKDFSKIKNNKIKQYYDNNNSLSLGMEKKIINGVQINIFNRERLLVELIRNKNKFSFDYYKEVISNYRKLIHKLDLQLIEEYAMQLPKSRLVLETLQLEIL